MKILIVSTVLAICMYVAPTLAEDTNSPEGLSEPHNRTPDACHEVTLSNGKKSQVCEGATSTNTAPPAPPPLTPAQRAADIKAEAAYSNENQATLQAEVKADNRETPSS